jgi:hypothetical protein
MAWSLVASAIAGQGSGGSITPQINAVGADLIILTVADYVGSGSGALTVGDSQGNTYTALNTYLNGNGAALHFFYTFAPVTSSSQTFSATGTSTYATLAAAAFQGSLGANLIDPFSGVQSGEGEEYTPGSVQTPAANCLVITGAFQDAAGGIPTVVSEGFTTIDFVTYSSGQNYGLAAAYLVAATMENLDPLWSPPSVPPAVVGTNIAVFLPEEAPPSPPISPPTTGNFPGGLLGAFWLPVLNTGAVLPRDIQYGSIAAPPPPPPPPPPTTSGVFTVFPPIHGFWKSVSQESDAKPAPPLPPSAIRIQSPPLSFPPVHGFWRQVQIQSDNSRGQPSPPPVVPPAPPGPVSVSAYPLLTRLPKGVALDERLKRGFNILAATYNSLSTQGILRQTGVESYTLDIWSLMDYYPGAVGDWSGTAPSTVGAALDRIAKWIKENGGSV